MLLHRLEQRRLGARAGPVDLVRHQQLGEDRAFEEAERAAPVGGLVEDLRAEDVGRHQVGRELHAPRVEPEHDPKRLDELRLGEARHADEQPVAAGQDRDEGEVDDPLLPEDDRVDGVAGRPIVSRVASADCTMAWSSVVGAWARLAVIRPVSWSSLIPAPRRNLRADDLALQLGRSAAAERAPCPDRGRLP